MKWQTVVFIFLLMTCKFLVPPGSPLFQKDINSLFDWCNLNGLHFHPSKCKAANVGGHDESPQFLLGSVYLPFNKQIKDLGFIVSITLSWKAHLDLKLLKCNKNFIFLKINIPFSVSYHRKLLLYRSLILLFLYGAPVWSPSSTMLHQIECFHYKVNRWIIRCSSYVLRLRNPSDTSCVLELNQR